MISEYISPPIDFVLPSGFLGILASLGLAKLAHVPWRPRIWLMLCGAALLTTTSSLVYSYTFRGGDYFWLRRGYPHYFWGVGASNDFQDMTLHNMLSGWDMGPLGIYVLGNALFYMSLWMGAYVILLTLQKRSRAAQ
ncbi:MAG: hypothetical protein BroJett039_10840 [Chloroflexota bacterium]|nr:MAG: hypothetical protein BroJett039_10840 [Chloroflexota bacterium]